MVVDQDNLLNVLSLAIKDQARIEKECGFEHDSATLDSWRRMYEHIRA